MNQRHHKHATPAAAEQRAERRYGHARVTIEFECLVLEMSSTGEVTHRRPFRAEDAATGVYGVKAGANDIERGSAGFEPA
jgi:hypothetical protein